MKITNIAIGTLAAFALTFGFSSSAFAGDAAKGQSLFGGAGKCKTCHKIDDKKLVGPGLAGTKDKHKAEWLKKWVADPQGTWTANDPETAELKKRVNKESKPKTAMAPGKLTDAEIDDVIAYLLTL